MTSRNFTDLLGKVRRSAAKNSFYVLISYFISAIITGVVVGFLLSPIILMNKGAAVPELVEGLEVTENAISDSVSTGSTTLTDFFATLPHGVSIVLTFVLLFLALQFCFVVNYGFSNMLFQMQREKFVTLGFLFNGFRNFKKAASLSALYSLVISLSLAASRGLTYLYRTYFMDAESDVSLAFLFGTVGAFLFIAFLILLPYSLAFFCSFDDEKATTKENLKKSRELLKKHKLELIGFVLGAGGRQLLTAIVAGICVQKLSMFSGGNGAEKTSGMISVLTLAIELIYIFNAYSAFTKMALAIPFYYGHLRFGKNGSTSSPTETAVPEHVEGVEVPDSESDNADS